MNESYMTVNSIFWQTFSEPLSILLYIVFFSYRKSGVAGAMEWLLQHESDPDIDEPIAVAKKPNDSTKLKRREVIPNRKVLYVLHAQKKLNKNANRIIFNNIFIY